MLWGGRWEGGSCLGTHVRIKDFKIKKQNKTKKNPKRLFSSSSLSAITTIVISLNMCVIWRAYCHARFLFTSVQSLSRVQPFVTPWTAAHKASLSITNSRTLLKLMSIASVMPSRHLILCHPLLLLPSIFLSIRVFSNAFLSQGSMMKIYLVQ